MSRTRHPVCVFALLLSGVAGCIEPELNSQDFLTHCPREQGQVCDILQPACVQRLWSYRACLAEEFELGPAPQVEVLWGRRDRKRVIDSVEASLLVMQTPLTALGGWGLGPVSGAPRMVLRDDAIWVEENYLRSFAGQSPYALTRVLDRAAQVRLKGPAAIIEPSASISEELARSAILDGRADLWATILRRAQNQTSAPGPDRSRPRLATEGPDREAILGTPLPLVETLAQIRSHGSGQVTHAWYQDKTAGVRALWPPPDNLVELLRPELNFTHKLPPANTPTGYQLVHEDSLGLWMTESITAGWPRDPKFARRGTGPDVWLQYEDVAGNAALLWGFRSQTSADWVELADAQGRSQGPDLRWPTAQRSGMPPDIGLAFSRSCAVIVWTQDPEARALFGGTALAWIEGHGFCTSE